MKNAQSHVDFDVYGHLDYVVRYGPNQNKFYTYEKYADVIDEILHTLITNGKGIELKGSNDKMQKIVSNLLEDGYLKSKIKPTYEIGELKEVLNIVQGE